MSRCLGVKLGSKLVCRARLLKSRSISRFLAENHLGRYVGPRHDWPHLSPHTPVVKRLARALLALALYGLPFLKAQTVPQRQRTNSPPAAELVLVNGRIFTADPTNPWAEAVAIAGDRIIAIGRTADMHAVVGRTTRRIDLEGRLVVPGFNDAHMHLGASLPGVSFQTSNDPIPDPSFAQVRDSLVVLVRQSPVGAWLRTDIDAAILDDSRARRAALDSVAPRNPVWLGANTGHGVILNSAALRALGIRDDPRDPIGGFYEREGTAFPGRGRGRTTGLLQEYAGWNAARTLRQTQSDSVLVAAFRRSADRAVRYGITSIQDMANALDPATTLRVLRAAKLPIRVRVVAMAASDSAGRRASEWTLATRNAGWLRLPLSGPQPQPVVSGVKWILDGTGIERMSLLRTPFADRPQWAGELNFSPDTVRAMLREALASGEQPVLHAIGDSTIALVFSLMESLAPDTTWRRLRPRLEHAEWLTPDLQPRARRLGIVVVENPTHFTDGPERMRERFGDARGRSYQPLRSLVDAGIALGIGSDGPSDPYLNIQLATTHPDNPREALTREAAVIAYTRGSAFAEHAEHTKGTLVPGDARRPCRAVTEHLHRQRGLARSHA